MSWEDPHPHPAPGRQVLVFIDCLASSMGGCVGKLIILAFNGVKLAEPDFTANSFYLRGYVGLLLYLLPAYAIVVKTRRPWNLAGTLK